MTELCCNDPLPVLSADGLNTVNCANCGGKYIHENAEYQAAMLALMTLTNTSTSNPDTVIVASSFKSLTKDARVHQFAGYVLDSCIRLLFEELAAQAPETRNRLSLAIDSPDGEFNLTFARGQYNNAMEDQRNEARAERDALRQQIESLVT